MAGSTAEPPPTQEFQQLQCWVMEWVGRPRCCAGRRCVLDTLGDGVLTLLAHANSWVAQPGSSSVSTQANCLVACLWLALVVRALGSVALNLAGSMQVLLLCSALGYRLGYYRATATGQRDRTEGESCCGPLGECEADKQSAVARAEEAAAVAQDMVNCIRPCITMCGLEASSKKAVKACSSTCLGHCESQTGIRPTEVDLTDPRGRVIHVVNRPAQG